MAEAPFMNRYRSGSESTAAMRGSRVQVHLGENDENGMATWVMVLDLGESPKQWQEQSWSAGIPIYVARQLSNCEAKGRKVTNVTFGRYGEWYVAGERPDGTGAHAWWGGVDQTCDEYIKSSTEITSISFGGTEWGSSWAAIEKKHGRQQGFSFFNVGPLGAQLEALNRERKYISNVCLSMHQVNGFFIKFQGGSVFQSFGEELTAELHRSDPADPVLHVCESTAGHWLVIRGYSFVANRGVPAELVEHLEHFYSQTSHIRQHTNHSRDFVEPADAKRTTMPKPPPGLIPEMPVEMPPGLDHSIPPHVRSRRASEESVGGISFRASPSFDPKHDPEVYRVAAQKLAREYGFEETGFDDSSQMATFLYIRNGQIRARIEIHIYSRTVSMYSRHMGACNKTVFRRDVPLDKLAMAFTKAQQPEDDEQDEQDDGDAEIDVLSKYLCATPAGTEELEAAFCRVVLSSRGESHKMPQVYLRQCLVTCRGKLRAQFTEDMRVSSFLEYSPLKESGMAPGDQIVCMHAPMVSWEQFRKAKPPAGNQVTLLRVLREGQFLNLMVKGDDKGVLGVTCAEGNFPVIEPIMGFDNIKEAGLRRGDRLVSMIFPVTAMEQLTGAVEPLSPGAVVGIMYVSDAKMMASSVNIWA